MRIEKGMYGLPQAGILVNKLLRERLAKRGYFELPHTLGLWTHVHRPVWFTLVVDDFGVKFVGKEHAHHLLCTEGALRYRDQLRGGLYCGINLEWDYENRHVDISMPGYL